MHDSGGKLTSATAEMLMRSRYSAYSMSLVDYLVETTAPKTRTKNLAADIKKSIGAICWLSLDIVNIEQGGPTDKIGKVEFIAHFTETGPDNISRTSSLHELSRFNRFQGHWVYLDGKILEG